MAVTKSKWYHLLDKQPKEYEDESVKDVGSVWRRYPWFDGKLLCVG